MKHLRILLALATVLTAAIAVGGRPAAPAQAALANQINDSTPRPLGAITVFGDSVLQGALITSPTIVDHLAARGWGPIRARAGVGYNTRTSGGPAEGHASYWIERWRNEGWDAPNVVINLGANDSGVCNTNVACARTSILRVVDALGPGHRVWWPQITRHPAYQSQADTWNLALRQIADERDDFFTWDWPAAMAAAGIYAADNTHPNAAGYRQRSELMAVDITAQLARGSRTGGPAPLPAPAGAPSELVPLTSERLLDTRKSGGWVGAEQFVEVDVSGSVPPGTTAVAVYVSATDTEGPGYITAYPCNRARPLASSANYGPAATRGAVALVPVPGGKFCLFTKAGAHLLADLQGAFVPATANPPGGARLSPLATPQRLVDTRESGRAGADGVLTVPVPAGADAVAVNLTAVGADADGYLTAYPCGTERPTAAAVNHRAREVVAGAAFVPVGPGGTICIYSKATDADVVVDLTATLREGTTGLVFTPSAPTRTIDTRDGTGGWSPVHGQWQTIDARVAPAGARAVSGTLTIAGPTAAGYLRAWGCGTQPETSNVNAPAGAAFANLVTTGIDADGNLCVLARSATATIFDTTGWWTTP
ncbi:MAG TPA: SGNH/GDSL hydrolase family protein [Ilumatobacter sp.]|nr:SGNH/GDSL hydrolase family protein [Ilumatobacter sp.]